MLAIGKEQMRRMVGGEDERCRKGSVSRKKKHKFKVHQVKIIF
jgi:hypothetical protein